MSRETENVAILKETYRLWHESKAGSVDHWLNLMTDDVKFRSLAEGTMPLDITKVAQSKNDVKRYFAGLTSD
ncbi:MAG: hypothetical protein FJ145_14095 [Deltaproteobacteria bacterium]|nr:hypothetical protein [Deltaproteobacteria bacterium]